MRPGWMTSARVRSASAARPTTQNSACSTLTAFNETYGSSPLNHWATELYAIVLQSRAPTRFILDAQASCAELLSTGSLPIAAVQTLATGRKRSSNLLMGGLLPRVDAAVESAVTPVNPSPGAPVTAVIDVSGILLSTPNDAAYLGLADAATGRVLRVFDQFTRPVADQTQLRLTIPTESAVPRAFYHVILRVNGAQALRSPEVNLT